MLTRTQIYLPSEQVQSAKLIGLAEGKNFSQFVREAIAEKLAKKPTKQKGKFKRLRWQDIKTYNLPSNGFDATRDHNDIYKI